MFENVLRRYLGQNAQVTTPIGTVTGVLLSVAAGILTVRTTPTYGETEDVPVPLASISFVRVFS